MNKFRQTERKRKITNYNARWQIHTEIVRSEIKSVVIYIVEKLSVHAINLIKLSNLFCVLTPCWFLLIRSFSSLSLSLNLSLHDSFCFPPFSMFHTHFFWLPPPLSLSLWWSLHHHHYLACVLSTLPIPERWINESIHWSQIHRLCNQAEHIFFSRSSIVNMTQSILEFVLAPWVVTTFYRRVISSEIKKRNSIYKIKSTSSLHLMTDDIGIMYTNLFE